MNSKKTHIYFVPGLGANSKIFEFIKLPKEKFELHFIEWLIPENRNETIAHYAKRMSKKVTHDNAVLIGVSFGGVMVQEMRKLCKPQKLVLISSIKSKNEMPSRMHFAQKTKAHKIIPTKVFSNIEKYEKFAFGSLIKDRVKLYKKYMSMHNQLYLQWSIDTIVNWDQEVVDTDILHIHGNKDFIFPIKNIKNYVVVEGGTHAMILTKAKKISEILQKQL